MKKLRATILSLLTITAAATLTATGLCAQKAPLLAQADVPQGEQLITPSTYEEFLSLTAPTDVAATDGYIAIADGSTLFIFDKDRNIWQEYSHANIITKLQFGSRDQLYFLDGQTNKLYLFNAKSFEAPVESGVVCSTFSIHGSDLYYINVSAGITSIYCAPLSNLENKIELYADLFYAPALSYWNGEIYYVDATGHLYKLNFTTGTPTEVADIPVGVISMTITEGFFCCATKAGGFYAYNLTELSDKGNADDCEQIANYVGNYTDVSAKGNDVYLVAGDRIEKFSLTAKAFASYSIGARSNASNRFDGASELTLAGNKLFISDDNNDRISVYNVDTNTFEAAIPCEADLPLLASDGESLLVSTTSQAILYSLENDAYGESLLTLTSDKISGNIIGATAVYGNYYLVTDTNYCYLLTEGEEGYTYTETLRNAHFAEKLTSDVNGSLYILHNNAIYRYTENNFLSEVEQGVKICEGIPSDTTKIAVDYGGNLYALASNVLYCYSPKAIDVYGLHSETTFDNALVYNASKDVLSFTFGIEDNETYILYKDNYLTVTNVLSLPTVKTIPTGNIADNIFGETAAFTVVQTLPNSFIVEVDGELLQTAETFPYLSSYRSKQPITALKIGEIGNYALLAYRENAASDYKTLLIGLSQQAELESEYAVTYETQKTGYLTNFSKVYKFPSMGLPALAILEKNAEVTILGELNGLDCEYYTVSCNEQTAYIPKSHILFFDGTPSTTEKVTIGEVPDTKGDMWRLAYLLLSSAAICVLVDTLILRKKHNED